MNLIRGAVNRSFLPLYQYDYGQRLILSGVELPESYEVHFSNSETGSSKTSVGNATGVDIPDEFLTSGENVHVWLFLHDGESDGETEYKGVINVYKRARPTNAAPTPVQQDAITQAIAALNAAVTESEAAADRAEAALSSKADKDNPVFTGSISMGRAANTVIGSNSTAVGLFVEASGTYAHAEGIRTAATALHAHAEGRETTASGNQSHAEGYLTTASQTNAHAEGRETVASGGNSHAEGEYCQAQKNASHAEGGSTVSAKKYSHAEGNQTLTTGMQSHAEGLGTIANHASQHVFGEYNVEDQNESDDESRGDFVEIVGNGTENERSNARTLDWDGNERLAGNLYVNGNQQVCSEGDIATAAETQAIIDEFVR